ncbi:MAG: phosphoribosyltransferase, partial [Thaumarchaeota archaeon]|nr:phosphoribosyltransferase [Nitrososphaerota archaeon]
MLFEDRLDAGERLADKLMDLKTHRCAVIAIPRGGVEVGYPIALRLDAPLEITVPRKIGAPGDPELAVGAVAEDGTIYVEESTASAIGVSREWIEAEAERELEEVRRRISLYRDGKPLPKLTGYT